MDRLGACFIQPMNSVICNFKNNRLTLPALAITCVGLLSACTGSSGGDDAGPIDTPPTGDFELRTLQRDLVLVEGDPAGLSIPLALSRQNGHDRPVELSISGVSADDAAFVSSRFTQLTLTPNSDESQIVLSLAIADKPLLPQQRDFIISASDGVDHDDTVVRLSVQPVDAPDIYLLVGQSNMVGFSGEGTRQAYPGGADQTNPRIKQLNVTENDGENRFVDAFDFTSTARNIMPPSLTVAEDPLHIPRDDTRQSGKDLEYIGLGLSFAKEALNHTSRDIVLVPAAWSGSSFCTNDQGPAGHWNSQAGTNPNLGNTWLFDRAVTRANLAIDQTGGVLRGILWHQGESDANDRCAPLYQANLERLIKQMRLNIKADRRGSDLRRADSNIPFIIGTMSRGSDERGDLSNFLPSKQLIDLAHRNLPNQLSSVGLSNHDDLVPANGYPCGNSTCVHFGASALREMGKRYHQALLRAAAQ